MRNVFLNLRIIQSLLVKYFTSATGSAVNEQFGLEHLAITFIIYITIPELGNTHGMIVLSNVVSVFLVTSYLLTVYNIQPDSSLSCSVLGYMV